MWKPKVSIIIPTYNRAGILKETLECLSHLDYPDDDYELIVVDDGSKDETGQLTKSFQSRIKNLVYHLKENGGASSARNEGARIAKADILLFNDDDIIVEPTMISQHLQTLSKFEKGLVGGHWDFSPQMIEVLNKTVFGRYRIAVEDWVKEENKKYHLRDNCYRATSISSQNFSFRREHFWDVGGFDPKFPYAGFEDHEFTRRVIKAGYLLVYDFDIKLSNNDLDRIDIETFGERQRRGAIVKVLVAHKNPEQYYQHSMIVENSSVKKGEAFTLSIKKLVKKILAKEAGLSFIIFLAKSFDKTWQSKYLVSKLYDIACGIYIFRGIQEGIKLYGEPNIYQMREDANMKEIEIFKSQRKFNIKDVK